MADPIYPFIHLFQKKVADPIYHLSFNPVSYLVRPLDVNDIKNIVAEGLDGVEVFHPDLNENKTKILYNLAKNDNWVFIGGSDFHLSKKIC